MLIRNDSVDSKGLDDGEKALQLLQQRFRGDQINKVINLMRQLTRLQLREDKAIQQYFNTAHGLVIHLPDAGEELSEMLCNIMVLNGLPLQFESFVNNIADRDDVVDNQHSPVAAKNASHQFGIHYYPNHILGILFLCHAVPKGLNFFLNKTNLDN